MDRQTQKLLRAAEKAVGQLVNRCAKHGALYVRHPGAVAQVSRTSKWLLNATRALRRELDDADASEPQAR